MATNANKTTGADVAIDAELFDQAFEPAFGPFEPFSADDRQRMSGEFATAFPQLTALLEDATRISA